MNNEQTILSGTGKTIVNETENTSPTGNVDIVHIDREISSAANNPVQMNDYQKTLNERYREEFTGMTIDAGRCVVNTMKENVSDYKMIDNDPNISSVEKAIGKRKLMLCDLGLGTGMIGGFMGLAWLAKKLFAA